jgi:hypothetical protein
MTDSVGQPLATVGVQVGKDTGRAEPGSWFGSPWLDWRGSPPSCCVRAQGESCTTHLAGVRKAPGLRVQREKSRVLGGRRNGEVFV